jgi:hypothetical protein
MSSSARIGSKKVYSFLGPVGTFTELALAQVKAAKGAVHKPVSSVTEAIDDVLSGAATRAIIPVENSIEGGVSATLDALANSENIRIFGEYLVPVTFNLVARPGMKLADVEVSQVTRMNDKTIATLKGTVFSKVSQMDFDVSVGTHDEPDENRYVKNQWNDQKWSKNGGCNRGLGNGIQNSLSGCSPGGCNTPSGCLKWLLYLLLLLLLLGLLGQCTQFGRTLHCYYDAWKEKKEILKLQEKKDKLIEKIEKTKKETTPCGKISDPNGKNTPKTYTFDLGQKSGTLRLR